MQPFSLNKWLLVLLSATAVILLISPGNVTAADGEPYYVFALYAPLDTSDLQQHLQDYSELLTNLQAAADESPAVKIEVLVRAMINDQTALILVEFNHQQPPIFISLVDQPMADPQLLTDFVDYIYHKYPDPNTELILAFEGHGGGYIPHNVVAPPPSDWPPAGDPHVSNTDDLPLTIGNDQLPHLPMGSPRLAADLMSTYQLGAALRQAITAHGRDRLALILLNNCFNFSTEVLHTIAPYAEYAVGYPNYNFFTTGAAYQQVIASLGEQPTSAELAVAFADTNNTLLNTNHPTVGSVVELTRLEDIVTALNALAVTFQDLLAVDRPTYHPLITATLHNSFHYDSTSCTIADYALDHQDSLLDVKSFAQTIMDTTGFPDTVYATAQTVVDQTSGLQIYEESGYPWFSPNSHWAFSEDLSLSIFFPMPRSYANGAYWDWRTTYYIQPFPDPNKPRIDFFAQTQWDEFVLDYHEGAIVDGLTVCLPTTITEDVMPILP